MESTGLFQKILGSILALILVLGIFPVGLLYFSTPVIAEDSLVRLSPTAEAYVYSDKANRSRSDLDDSGCLVIGNYWNTYLKFDLTSLGNIKRADLSRACLRFAILDNGMTEPDHTDCTFNISYVNNNDWNENMTWSSKPMGDEQYICTATGGSSGDILEIDISEFIRETAGFDDKTVTLKLSPSLSNNAPIRLAAADNEDPSLRPYLKVLTGDVTDSDPTDLKKAYLAADGYTADAYPDTDAAELRDRNNGILAVDNGSVAYITFGLNLRNITGAVYNAELVLRPKSGSVNTTADVYMLSDDGERTLIKSLSGVDLSGELRIDVTDCIYDAAANGKTTVRFALDGRNTPAESTDTLEIYSSQFPELAPRLEIYNTDDKHTVAICEAMRKLAGDNSSLDNITTDLPGDYTASNGEKVTIRWGSGFSIDELLNFTRQTVFSDGTIQQPTQFDGAKTENIKVTLSCGGKLYEKFVTITVQPDVSSGRHTELYDALW